MTHSNVQEASSASSKAGNHLTRNIENLLLSIRREIIDENKGKQMSEDKHADDM